jgi:hypothetical protein
MGEDCTNNRRRDCTHSSGLRGLTIRDPNGRSTETPYAPAVTRHVITDEATIVAVMASNSLTPPPRRGDGSALQLRAAMARFALPGAHPQRREDVVVAIAALDRTLLHAYTCVATRRRLVGPVVDVLPAVARAVPVEALAVAYGLVASDDHATIDRLLADMELVVAVVARGREPSDDADEAADRLLQLAADHPLGVLPVVSVLYQSFDATAALIATMLDAEAGARTRTAAIPRTVRQALVDVTFGELELAQGDDVQLEIGTPTLEFGSGPHRCPGRDVAELIATSVVDTLAVTGYVVDLSTVVHDEDGRPMSLSVRRPGRSTDVQ